MLRSEMPTVTNSTDTHCRSGGSRLFINGGEMPLCSAAHRIFTVKVEKTIARVRKPQLTSATGIFAVVNFYPARFLSDIRMLYDTSDTHYSVNPLFRLGCQSTSVIPTISNYYALIQTQVISDI